MYNEDPCNKALVGNGAKLGKNGLSSIDAMSYAAQQAAGDAS